MTILIINCHWDNRGDEAAIRAMLDELQLQYPEAMFYVQRALGEFSVFPENEHLKKLPAFPVEGKKRWLFEKLSLLTNGKINITRGAREFYKVLSNATIVLHAPGGPSIGDIYLQQEKVKLGRLKAIKNYGAYYAFYAPSMGPFKNAERNPLRKEILENASLICLREEVSEMMLREFVPTCNPIVTLDSAFQHSISIKENMDKLNQYKELKDFIYDGEKVIGMTLTDLQWNSLYKNDGRTEKNIRDVFSKFVFYLREQGYCVLFIPQLFEGATDFNYMKSFAIEGCLVMSDQYDCYFQQYVISKLKAVVGMRYHSNIFSAKMGTPFISISYEQKMQGFMTKAGLMNYCLSINDLTLDSIKEKFKNMMACYDEYKRVLEVKKTEFKMEASRTTKLVCELIDSLNKKSGSC